VRILAFVVLCALVPVARAELAVAEEIEIAPRQVVGYQNGRAIKLEVTDVDGVLVEVNTAKALLAMKHAADKDGVYLQAWSGFRSNEKQQELYDAWKAGSGNPAAKPGYSNHQSGRAVDINLLGVPKETYAWLLKHAGKFGFNRTVPSEPWHWEYTPPRRVAGRRVIATFAASGAPQRRSTNTSSSTAAR
jgi:LAS superfamily LD-carboxypeptidase LdcB